MTQTNPNPSKPAGSAPEIAPLSYPAIAPTPPTFGASSSTPGGQPAAISMPRAPLPHRPKGRLFIAALLFSVIGGFGFYFFDNYVRYAAYGEVVGRKIELAPPWAGVVTALHVRVGDTVRQGDPIFNVDSIKMRHRMAQIEDSLNLQRARLTSELARLKWEAERVEDTQQLVKAEYYEKWSEQLWEESVLSDLQQQLARGETLQVHDAIAVEKLESSRCRVAGQVQRVQQLSKAVESLQRRLETDRPIDPNLNDQIKPALVNIENLQEELRRMRQLLDQGVVTAPTNGRVTRIQKYSGEYVEDNNSVIELFVDGSAEIVLYLPQSKSQQWSTGDSLDVRIEPAARRLTCEVTRVAPEMGSAPKSIMRHYAADEILLPIVVRPTDPHHAQQLVLGSKVRLPRTSPDSRVRSIAAWLRGGGATDESNPISEPTRTLEERIGNSALARTFVSTSRAQEPETLANAPERETSDPLPVVVQSAAPKPEQDADSNSKSMLARSHPDSVVRTIAAWLRGGAVARTSEAESDSRAGGAIQQQVEVSEQSAPSANAASARASDTFVNENENSASDALPIAVRSAEPKKAANVVPPRKMQSSGDRPDSAFRTIAAWLRGGGATVASDAETDPRPRPTLQKQTETRAEETAFVNASKLQETDTSVDENKDASRSDPLPVVVRPEDPKQARTLSPRSKTELFHARPDAMHPAMVARQRVEPQELAIDSDCMVRPKPTHRVRPPASADKSTLARTCHGHESNLLAERTEDATSDSVPIAVRRIDPAHVATRVSDSLKRQSRASPRSVFRTVAARLGGAVATNDTDTDSRLQRTIRKPSGTSAHSHTFVNANRKYDTNTFAGANEVGPGETFLPIVVPPD